ncbi:MAG: S9 family peptidase, partial [Saprospiraceae bacterium]
MSKVGLIISLIGFLACNSPKSLELKTPDQKISYPNTAEKVTEDIYFDTKIVDPYRWLENDVSKETESWVNEQNKVTFDYLNTIPFRNAFKSRLEKLWNYEKISAPFVEGSYTYFYKNDGLQNQFVLWRKKGDMSAEIFLDPNTFSKDGTSSLAGISFSKNGSKVAYQISEGGSDWRKVIIMDAETKSILEDTLIDIKFSGLSWKGDEGFYYSSYDKPKGSQLSAKTDQHKLYYHLLGTKQKSDKVIFGKDIKRRYVGGSVSADDKFLFITASNATYGNELYLISLDDPLQNIVVLQDHYNNDSDVIDNQGTKLYILTDVNAPNKKVVTVDVSDPTVEHWKDFIPETDHALRVVAGCGYFFTHYMKDALSAIYQYDYEGKFIREIALPGAGSANLGEAKKTDDKIYFSFTNYIT